MLESTIAFAQENQRVCPVPTRWNELWHLLPERRRVGVGWEPALPLILAAWHGSPLIAKIVRLREHLEYANAHGALPEVDRFLRSLPESEWAHVSDFTSVAV